jgi:hypothetical protein
MKEDTENKKNKQALLSFPELTYTFGSTISLQLSIHHTYYNQNKKKQNKTKQSII